MTNNGSVRQNLGIGGLARGGLFLFVGSLTSAIVGFVYWFLISIFGGAQVVGIASSVYSLSVLVSGLATLGVPIGVQRFLGRNYGIRNIEGVNTYFWSSLVLTSILCTASGIAVWCMTIINLSVFGFSGEMLFLAGFCSALGFSGIISSLFASILKTEYVAASIIISSMIRLFLGVSLVRFGLGWIGAAVGLISESLFIVVLMLFFASRALRRLGGARPVVSLKAMRQSLGAGLASWLPGVVALVGQQLSFLAVFGLQGSLEAGTYYIAYAVFGIIYMLPSSFMSILFPILSGLTEGDNEVAWRVLKLSLGIACPSTVFLMLYSAFPLSIMGGNYVEAAPALTILALSTIPLTFVSAVTSLVYARGSYGRVLGIGLAINVPRTILYFLLVPVYSGFGAALSFLIGAMTGLGTAVYVAKKASLGISRGKIAIAVFVPFAAGLPCFLLGLNWLVGGTVILISSVLCYARLGVVERDDLAEIARGFTSEKTIARLGERLNWILRIIYGE